MSRVAVAVWLASGAGAVLGSACTGSSPPPPEETGEPSASPSGDTSPTGDSGTEKTTKKPPTGESLQTGKVSAAWGVSAKGELETVTLEDGTEIRPHVTVYWGIDIWDGDLSRTEEYCSATAWLDDGELMKEPPLPHPFGVAVVAPFTTESDCVDRGFDLSVFPKGDPAAGSFPPNLTWTVGFGGPLGPGLTAFLGDEEIADLDLLIGGVLLSPRVDYGGSPNVYVRGWRVDEKMAVELDKGEQIGIPPGELLETKKGAPSGLYELTVPFLLQGP